MASKNKWVKYWRKSLDNPLFKHPLTWHFWDYCLLKATKYERETFMNGILVKLEAGSFVFGRRVASEETGLSQATIRTSIKRLVNSGNLTIKSTNKYSIISITNWATYQANENEINQHINQGPTSNQPATNHRQEREKVRKEETNTLNTSNEASSLCPQKEIISLWKTILPELPAPRNWDDSTRQQLLRARWRENPKRQNLEWWGGFFKFIRSCPFLMGEVEPSNGHKRFELDLPWALKKANFLKIIEGKYQNKESKEA